MVDTEKGTMSDLDIAAEVKKSEDAILELSKDTPTEWSISGDSSVKEQKDAMNAMMKAVELHQLILKETQRLEVLAKKNGLKPSDFKSSHADMNLQAMNMYLEDGIPEMYTEEYEKKHPELFSDFDPNNPFPEIIECFDGLKPDNNSDNPFPEMMEFFEGLKPDNNPNN